MELVVLLIIIDQTTKIWASNLEDSIVVVKELLNFTYVENRGAIFGFMQGSNYIMAGLSIVVCIVLIVYLRKIIKDGRTPGLGIYMIIAGGIGNIIDRMVRGYVVDFIDTPFIATFNVADSLIVIGVIFILLSEVKGIFKNGK